MAPSIFTRRKPLPEDSKLERLRSASTSLTRSNSDATSGATPPSRQHAHTRIRSASAAGNHPLPPPPPPPRNSSSSSIITIASSSSRRPRNLSSSTSTDTIPEEDTTARIKVLESAKHALTTELAQHSSRINALRASHQKIVDSLNAAHAHELAQLRKQLAPSSPPSLSEDTPPPTPKDLNMRHLTSVVASQSSALETLRTDNSGLLGRVSVLERALADRDGQISQLRRKLLALQTELDRRDEVEKSLEQLSLADMGRKLVDEMRRRQELERQLDRNRDEHRSDLRRLLDEEARKLEEFKAQANKEKVKVLAAEERTRQELEERHKEELEEVRKTWGLKVAEMEVSRRDSMERTLELARRDKEVAAAQVLELTSELDRKDAELSLRSKGNEELVKMVRKINSRLAEEKRKNRQLDDPPSSPPCSPNITSALQLLQHEVDLRNERILDLEHECGELRDTLAESEKEVKRARAEKKDVERAARRMLIRGVLVRGEVTKDAARRKRESAVGIGPMLPVPKRGLPPLPPEKEGEAEADMSDEVEGEIGSDVNGGAEKGEREMKDRMGEDGDEDDEAGEEFVW